MDQQSGETASQPRQVTVSGDTAAVSLVSDHGNLTVKSAEIVEQCSKVVVQGVSDWLPD
jgi:hypothetical protein